MGVAAIGYLTLGLATSKDPTYKIRIVEALGVLAPASRTIVLLALAGAAKDKDPAVRMAVTRVVASLRPISAEAPRPIPTVA